MCSLANYLFQPIIPAVLRANHRVSGEVLLGELYDEYDSSAATAVLEAVKRRLAEADEAAQRGSKHWWKLREAALQALGSFSEFLVEVGIQQQKSNDCTACCECTADPNYGCCRGKHMSWFTVFRISFSCKSLHLPHAFLLMANLWLPDGV